MSAVQCSVPLKEKKEKNIYLFMYTSFVNKHTCTRVTGRLDASEISENMTWLPSSMPMALYAYCMQPSVKSVVFECAWYSIACCKT